MAGWLMASALDPTRWIFGRQSAPVVFNPASLWLFQEEDLQFDYVTVMLRCTETFDDEDF